MLEKDVKAALSKFLKENGCYWHMHVPVGYGRTTIDYLGCYRGLFFGIETKRKGGELSCTQREIIRQIANAGGSAWVEDNLDLELTRMMFKNMDAWLSFSIRKTMP